MAWLLVAALALQGKGAVGDKATVSVESTLDLDYTVEDGNGKVNRQLHVGRREKFAQQVTKVGADGLPEAADIKCLSSSIERSGTNELLVTDNTPLAGRDFKAERTPAGWVARDAEGNPPPPGGQALGAWNDAARLLPKAPPDVNASWKAEAADLAPVLFGASVSEPAGSLECVCEAKNGDQWVVTFKGVVTSKSRDGAALILTVAAGKLTYDAAKGRPAGLSVGGAVESKREITESEREPGKETEIIRKRGEITAKSTKFEVVFTFE